MIRVARIITRLNVGGPAIQAVTLSDRLSAHGFETLLIHGRLSPGEGDMGYLLEGREVQTRDVPAMQRSIAPASDARAVAEVRRILAEFEPQIVHTHTAKAGTVGRAAAWLHNRSRRGATRARTVHTYHGHSLEGYFWYAGVFRAIERALARTTDRIVAISPQIAVELRDRHHIGRPEQYAVVPLGFELAPFAAITDADRAAARQAFGLAPDAQTVSIVGRLTSIKQHELFLRVAQAVHARCPAVVFLIVGDGERRGELEALARQLGLGEAVRFVGWRRDLEVVYAATSVCVLTSRNEGTPVALIEALAAGVPVVSTAVGGVRDVVNDPALGDTAADGAADALADGVIRALAPEQHAPELVAIRRASMAARYSFDRLAHDIAALYRSLLESAPDE